jgi:NAD(P)-dependent dehydrogenase (short-subunit alcohol dehydrogenase family)
VKAVLVVGGSRGLGLEFVRQYLAEGWTVYATARRARDLSVLGELGAEAIKLDVTSPNDFLALQFFLRRRKLDVAIYNAGVYGPKMLTISAISRAEFDNVMHTNVWGAVLCVSAVAPAISRANGKMVFISSTMGSIAHMDGHNRVAYRASKSALNAVAKASALEWGKKDVICVSMHPGWVRTDMGGLEADLEANESVTGMRDVIRRLKRNSNGCFLNYQGQSEPW